MRLLQFSPQNWMGTDLEVRDYSSMNEKANVYGIATRLPEKEEKVMILFEPTSRMVELMQKKCPEIVSLS